MTNPVRSVPWLRVFAEGAVIVLSILLAFGIDAWWEGRQERAEEREALEALADDFDAAARELESERLLVDSLLTASHAILRWTGPDADSRHVDSLALVLPELSRMPNYQPPTGTLDALVGSGDLRLIRSDTLRAALASFQNRLAAHKRSEGFGADMLFGEYLPYLNEVLPMKRFGLGGDGVSRFEVDVGALLRSMEFENQIQHRVTNLQFLAASVQRFGVFLDGLRAMLGEELRD